MVSNPQRITYTQILVEFPWAIKPFKSDETTTHP